MKTQSATKFRLLSATVMAASLLSPAFAEEAEAPNTLKEALAESKPIFNLRTRLETVDVDGVDETASALTYRVRAGFVTGAFKDTKALIEFEHVQDVVDDYNAPAQPKAGYPTVLDQNTTELNRLQLTNTSLSDTKITLGRQIITLDDHRFIGHVGWRQDIQTYDALRVTNTSIDNLTVDVGYINRVNRIHPDDRKVNGPSAGFWDGDSYFANVAYKTPIGKLSGFAYMVDADQAARLSTETIGARFAGAQDVGPGKLNYALSYAQQSEFGSSTADYSADYYLIDAGYSANKFKVGAGYEVLGADKDAELGFVTPFATLHKFQGWADVFLATPGDGLEDMYLSANFAPGEVGPFKGVKLGLVYHDFAAAESSVDYGSEIDFVLGAKWDVLAFTLKYADYSEGDEDSGTTSLSKLWFQVDYAF